MARLGRQWSDDERRRRKARRWLHSWLRAAWWVSLAAAAFLIYQAATPTVWWVEMTQPVGWLLLAGFSGTACDHKRCDRPALAEAPSVPEFYEGQPTDRSVSGEP
jgi:hypothetical protein